MSWKDKFLNRLIVGNCLDVLKGIPDNSINMVITSPPYFQQRNYGNDESIGNETTVDEYIKNLMAVFDECIRIIKEDGHIVFNLGDKYNNGSLMLVPYRFAIEILDKKPVKLINTINWIKLNPTPRQYKKRLVNSTEPFFNFVKSDNYYYNLDDFMDIHSLSKRKTKGKNSKIGEKYFNLIDNSNLTEEQKKNAKIELEKVINEVKTGKIAGFRMKIKGIHALPFGGQEGGRKIQIEKNGFTIIRISGKCLKKDVIESPVESIKGVKHPAIYPEFVVGELIKLLCPSEGIVLDPFVGSGTTCVVAKKLGRKYIGIDLNPEYIEYAEKRLNDVDMQLDYII